MRKLVLGAAALVGFVALLASCNGSDDGTNPDGGASDYVSSTPLPTPPHINLVYPPGGNTKCTPKEGKITIEVSNLQPGVVYTLWTGRFNRENTREVLTPDADGRDTVMFDCKGHSVGHYGVKVSYADSESVKDGFSVFKHLP